MSVKIDYQTKKKGKYNVRKFYSCVKKILV